MLHVHHHFDCDTLDLFDHLCRTLHQLNEKVDCIMASQQELTAKLSAVAAQQDKTIGEIQDLQVSMDDLRAEIVRLQEIVDQGGAIGPELETAVQTVADKAQIADDQIPDKPSPVVV